MYVIQHVRTHFTLERPPDVKLSVIKDALEEHWEFFKAAEYDLLVDENEKMDEDSWDMYLAELPVHQAVTVKVTSRGRSFSQYIGRKDLRRLARDHLGVPYMDDNTGPETDEHLFPELTVEPGYRINGQTSFEELLDTLVGTLGFLADAKEEVISTEISQRELISPVLATALLLARAKGPEGQLCMRPDYHVVGKMAWGPVDYVILYRTVAVVVAEARRYSPTQAWAKAIMQISATRDSLLRRLSGVSDAKKRNHWEATELSKIPTFAVLCTATNYRLLLYRPAGYKNRQWPSLVTSKEVPVPIVPNGNREAIKPFLRLLVGKLANVLVALMHDIYDAYAANPGLTLSTLDDPVCGPHVVAAAMEAAADHIDEVADSDAECACGCPGCPGCSGALRATLVRRTHGVGIRMDERFVPIVFKLRCGELGLYNSGVDATAAESPRDTGAAEVRKGGFATFRMPVSGPSPPAATGAGASKSGGLHGDAKAGWAANGRAATDGARGLSDAGRH
ncbi:hypothetical protein GPECTOR_9g512 [Gonium pectorale]|uniref:Uncharacterized protein n=1 Tax=Gonium pectorale TaxID=33097 RepID=A0A150GRV0_GONPE|nr:hypothetical protein GPECTOR_9g512 [Gonium pectorale]|eukprot:KXZ52468.1 hypothetical protein GPECTOR_9g512 [Gonium pectorale]